MKILLTMIGKNSLPCDVKNILPRTSVSHESIPNVFKAFAWTGLGNCPCDNIGNLHIDYPLFLKYQNLKRLCMLPKCLKSYEIPWCILGIILV